MDEVVSLTQALVQFDTVNPPGQEEAAIRHLGQYLERNGLQVEYQRLAEQRLNLTARIRGHREGHLVLCGHMDVVHPGAADWEHGPFEGAIVDGRLIGRGSADMKGGVAAMAVAMVELAKSGFEPDGDLILAVTSGEEVDMAGARLIAKSEMLQGSAYFVIGEPTGLDVFRAEKGVLWVRITARGRTAHGSMPHLGVNAISYVSRLITRLESYPFPFTASPVLGSPTVSVNVIEGGVKVNVVPDQCVVQIDLRLVPGQTASQVLSQLRQVMSDVADEIPAEAQLDVMQDVPAIETDSRDPLVEAVVRAVREVRQVEPVVGGVSYGTDGAILAPAVRASMIVFGPGSPGQAHQPNEYVDLPELNHAVEAYMLIARSLLTRSTV